MLRYTETWKPAWRGLHRIGCVLAVCATLLMLLVQISWMFGAFVRPHRLLEMSLGDSYWAAVTTEFYDGVGIRGGSRAWNLRVTGSSAEALRAKCRGNAGFQSIAQMRIPVKAEIPPPGSESAVSWRTTMEHLIEADKRLPQGCLLGWERDPEGKSGSQTILFGRVIQIEEWVD